MGYNNNNNNGYNNNNNGYNNNNNNNNGNAPVKKKHSGCKKHTATDGKGIFITGWNFSKDAGMVSFIAGPYKGTKRTISASGKHWENWFLKMTHKRTSTVTNHSAMYHVETGKLYLKELNKIANYKAKNGGYFGKHISKTYN